MNYFIVCNFAHAKKFYIKVKRNIGINNNEKHTSKDPTNHNIYFFNLYLHYNY